MKKTAKLLTKHDLESIRASDAAKDEVTSYRDPRCIRRHIANCECRGDARAPIIEPGN